MYMWELFVSPVRRRVFTVTYLLCEDSEVAWRWNFAVSTPLIIKKLIICENSLYKVSGTASVFSLSIFFCIWCHTPTIFRITDIVYLITDIIFFITFTISSFWHHFYCVWHQIIVFLCIRISYALLVFNILKSMTSISICVSNILCTAICITMLLTSILVKKRVTYLILYGFLSFSQCFFFSLK